MRLLLLALALAVLPGAALRPSTRRKVISGGLTSSLAAATALPAHAAKSRDDPSYEVRKTVGEWKESLTDYQYFVLRNGGTEPPGSSPLVKEKRAGVFRCSACDYPLFKSDQKFESGTGWPSFASPIEGHVEVQDVNALQKAALGAECRCARCGGHLGDVFLDGFLFPGTPAFATGKRYCMDGTSLAFEPSGAPEGTRVSGESKQARSPADVDLPPWLQPPVPRQAA